MKFDTIIIGGGQSGLEKGTELAQQGKRVCLVNQGRSTISIRYAAVDIMDYDARLRQGLEKERLMKSNFRQSGGILLDGDEVVEGIVDNCRVEGVRTQKLKDEILAADEYYLASGSFVSRGLRSNYQGIFEPVFGLDVDAPQTPAEWINADFATDQSFMHAHVVTDSEGRGVKAGKAIENLYCIGTVAKGM